MTGSVTFWLALAAVACGALGSGLLYLASPHQRGLPRAWTTRWRHLPGGLLMLASLGLFFQIQGSGTAVFSWLTLLMLVLSVAPFVAVLRGAPGGSRR